ncbi:MAG: carbohydrate binding domain-containing protein [Marinilabiliaceae bacterium]|nr:carbohydrate binding domain-containing protein [Marinilabiliaceae bacterium]
MNKIFCAAALGLFSVASVAQTTINIDAKKPGAAIPSTLYGIFFEDINYAADGGLYAEMVKNRSFEFPQALMGWTSFGHVDVRNDGPFERNPHYVRLTDPGHGEKRTGLENEGFFGVTVKADAEYNFSVWARSEDQKESKIRVEIINPASMGESQVLAHQDITIIDNGEWNKYKITLKPKQDVQRGRLRIFLVGKNGVDLEHVSLFPADTWKGRENGMRTDLAQALADLKPGIFRFPGGCIVEGTDLETRYQWKNSIGQVENRPLNENRWHYTFPHRFYPDYYQSYGIGFYEYFLLSEDIGAEPLPVISCGLACQFQNRNDDAHVPVDELQPYIDDALDLIEFANGDETTKWGKIRSEMGHKAPFNLKYLAVGNEQWGKLYPERLEKFITAIRAKYPKIKIVGTSGPDSEGDKFDYLWPEMRRLKVDLVDEHFYRPESWFLSQGNRYDNYDRKGPKVFAGEYACHGKGKKWNHFNAALLEAAFMTNIERNADVVEMATYAPLFAHVEGWQWRPDMIWYDNSRSVRSCSYYVQQLYSLNKGKNVLKTTDAKGKPLAGNDGQNGLFASSVVDADGSIIVKVINTSDDNQKITLNVSGLKKKALAGVKVTSYTSDKLDADNTLDNPEAIVPTTSSDAASGNVYNATLNAKTFSVYRFEVK